MRCPKCGFISFDDLVACAKCNLQLEGKNAPPFEGTAIRAQYAFFLRAADNDQPEPEPLAADEQDATDDLYKELAAESLEAGLTGGGTAGEDEFDLSEADQAEDDEITLTAAAENEGEELQLLESEEEIEIPAIDLSAFGDEGHEEEAGRAAAPENADAEDFGGGSDSDGEGLDLELAFGEEELALDVVAGEEEHEKIDLIAAGEPELARASQGAATNLDGIDLSGLIGGEDEESDSDKEEVDGIYDLSDLMTEEGDADDVLALDAGEEDSREPAAEEEELLDLTFDEEDEEPGTDSLELDQETTGADDEELKLILAEEETGEEKPSPPQADISPSGLRLENEEDA